MRPRPLAPGFQPCRPGNVSRAAKLASSAVAKASCCHAASACGLVRVPDQVRGLVWAGRPGLHPRLDQLGRLLPRAGSRLASVSGRPCPADKGLLADVLNQRFKRPIAVACRILDLRTDLGKRLALPCHFKRGEMPDRVPGDAGGIKVGLAMADRAAHGGKPISVRSTPDRGLVEPARIALTRTVAGRMAVHA